jgi:hypothetical protein
VHMTDATRITDADFDLGFGSAPATDTTPHPGSLADARGYKGLDLNDRRVADADNERASRNGLSRSQEYRRRARGG